MRSLTRSEAAVMGALLADLRGGERERIERAGVPRTTFQTARQRAVSNAWLLERFVPSPRLAEVETVSLIVAQPFAEHHAEVRRPLEQFPGTVVLWDTPETLLAVLFATPRTGAVPWPTSSEALPASVQRGWRVTVGAGGSDLPALFDYEGSWSKNMLTRSAATYPRGLPVPGRSGGLPPAGRAREELLRRVLRIPSAPPDGGAPGPIEEFRIGRMRRRLMASGDLERRFVLDPCQAPPVPERPIERVILVSGLRRAGADPGQLLGALHQRFEVAPFLYAYDPGRVIFAGLSPVRSDGPPRSGSVLAYLRRYLERIEIIREPLASIRTPINHRYDRLWATGS
jgi:hypothetical protein